MRTVGMPRAEASPGGDRQNHPGTRRRRWGCTWNQLTYGLSSKHTGHTGYAAPSLRRTLRRTYLTRFSGLGRP